MKSDLITVTGHRSKMSIELVEEEGTHHSPIISNKRKSRINRLLIVLIIQSIGLIGLDHLRKSKGPFSDETLRCDQPKRIVFVTICRLAAPFFYFPGSPAESNQTCWTYASRQAMKNCTSRLFEMSLFVTFFGCFLTRKKALK